MSVVMSDNFVGTPGQIFSGDSVYSINTGTPVLTASHYGVAVRFPQAAQTMIQYSFTATSGPRVFSRIYRLSAAPGAVCDIWHVRLAPSGASNGPGAILLTDGKLRLSGSTIATTVNPVPFGTEFRVVYTINSAGTLLSAAVYPNITSTTPTETISVSITNASYDTCREGVFVAGGFPSATFDIAWPVDDNASDPGLRIYVYVTLDRSSGIVPKLVTATAAVENAPSGTQAWTFTWGDGATTGPQAGATATHTYTTAGTYNATVTLDVT